MRKTGISEFGFEATSFTVYETATRGSGVDETLNSEEDSEEDVAANPAMYIGANTAPKAASPAAPKAAARTGETNSKTCRTMSACARCSLQAFLLSVRQNWPTLLR